MEKQKNLSKFDFSKTSFLPVSDEYIEIRGARVHNLKNVDIKIPRNSLVVFTGLSGSGKSSLAFDTIYAEGQRRYIESMSTYARQFIAKPEKPDVDYVEGLSPTISIEQKTTTYNPRSTVGTVTEIYDFLRILFTRIAKPICYECKKPIESQTPKQISDQILSFSEGTKISILSPIVRDRKGEYQKELELLRQRGFVRVKIDGETLDLSQDISLDKNKKHDISVYVDRLIVRGDRNQLASRVSESVESALKLSSGYLILEFTGDLTKKDIFISQKFTCHDCGINYPAPEPRLFSYNSSWGACESCDGLGVEPSVANDESFVDETKETEIPDIQKEIKKCLSCNGARLKKEPLHFLIHKKSIHDFSLLTLEGLKNLLVDLPLTPREKLISDKIIQELKRKLNFLIDVGVGYLTLLRSAQTLSGGESQRIRLATQISSSLTGVIYVLDEPSIGLHQHDNSKLIESLLSLKQAGNTVLVVEHDEDTMKASDYIVDVGPLAGIHGGEIVAQGDYKTFINDKKSLTAKYLRGDLSIPVPDKRRDVNIKKSLTLTGVSENNLKNITAYFPVGCLTFVTGVSGSGKSSLVIDALYPLLIKNIYKLKSLNPKVISAQNLDAIDKVIKIDQSPIGRTPRSNPATYIGLFSMIRDLFSNLPEAKIRGFKPGRFSFNVKGGRCENCEGDGATRVSMHFLPDVFVECTVCNGRRYNRETLEIKFKSKSIADVLAMSVDEALLFFDSIPSIKQRLTVLNQVGLGYIKVGQSATTLSGGEAQRVKLAKELARRSTGKTLYILDEPSTGLHFEDIKKLLQILHTLVDQGNTVVVIEHHLDMIKTADYVLDLGPQGGENGGSLLFSGTPEDLCLEKSSITAKYLKPYLKNKKGK